MIVNLFLLAKDIWICLVFLVRRWRVFAWISIHKPNMLPVVGFLLSLIGFLIHLSTIVLCYVCTLLWNLVHPYYPKMPGPYYPKMLGSLCRSFDFAFSKDLFGSMFVFSFYNQKRFWSFWVITIFWTSVILRSFPGHVKWSAKATWWFEICLVVVLTRGICCHCWWITLSSSFLWHIYLFTLFTFDYNSSNIY